MQTKLTTGQERYLAEFRAQFRSRKRAPSLNEIGEALGVSSTQAWRVARALVESGHLETVEIGNGRVAYRPRGGR